MIMPIDTFILPQMLKIRQIYAQPKIMDIPSTVITQLNQLNLQKIVKKGQTIAITAGSRGILHMDKILSTIVSYFQKIGAKPFIFPAMGSHGGGTAEGQLEVLKNYKITEEAIHCPIKASMDVDIIDTTSLGTPIFIDRYAHQADHIFVVNRIKPHTKFTGRVESGLMKMCLIGMGKREGARTYHRAIAHHSWDTIVNAATNKIISNLSILGGLAIIQNANEELAELHCLPPEKFECEEPKLLEIARNLMAKIPFNNIDLLIVDEMGKEISGTGMDTNITGRKEGSKMQINRVYIRSLTDQSHGNAQGIGLADYTLQSLVDKIDIPATYINSQTAYRTDTCKIPMTLSSDFEVMKIARRMCGVDDNPNNFRIIWIKNTLELQTFYASEAFMSEILDESHLQIENSSLQFQFTVNNTMILK